jgi:hypothetical protein
MSDPRLGDEELPDIDDDELQDEHREDFAPIEKADALLDETFDAVPPEPDEPTGVGEDPDATDD